MNTGRVPKKLRLRDADPQKQTEKRVAACIKEKRFANFGRGFFITFEKYNCH